MGFIEYDGEDETVGQIEMKPCNKDEIQVFKDAHSESKDKIIKRHVKAQQFFCPEDVDIEIWGEKHDVHHKILTVEIGECDPEKLIGTG